MINVSFSLAFGDVLEKARKAQLRTLKRAGFAVRKQAQGSIVSGDAPSAPGSPPHTKRGQIRRAILYSVDEQAMSVVIGPSVRLVSDSARAHEHGGRFRNQNYPRRPFMGPALEESQDTIAQLWADSVS